MYNIFCWENKELVNTYFYYSRNINSYLAMMLYSLFKLNKLMNRFFIFVFEEKYCKFYYIYNCMYISVISYMFIFTLLLLYPSIITKAIELH